MVEIDPVEAVAIRKQYNWGRQPFEGGVVMPDNQNCLSWSRCNTPGILTKFVATTAGDFTTGRSFLLQSGCTWEMGYSRYDNNDMTTMLHFARTLAIAHGATMFNRIGVGSLQSC